MFQDLKDGGEQGLISRELRLFACACCRNVKELIDDERSWQAVDVAERYADRVASRIELRAAYDAAAEAVRSIRQRIKQINSAANARVGTRDTETRRLLEIDDWHPEGRRRNAATAARFCANTRIVGSEADPQLRYCGDWSLARAAALYAYKARASRCSLESMEAAAALRSEDIDYLMYEDGWQADLVRCIFGNPFRPIATDKLDVEPRSRDLAESIYRLRAFDRMPILGKELGASACVDSDLVSHCTRGRVHARGCWALDIARGFKRDVTSCYVGFG